MNLGTTMKLTSNPAHHLHPFHPHASFRPRWLIFTAICAIIFLAAAACKLQANASSSKDQAVLLQFLRYVADDPGNRKWTSFGDAAAWHSSWDVPRIASTAELDKLADSPHADWLYIMPAQTTIPESLDANYLFSYSLKATYGFDIFDMDRYLFAGAPPKVVTLAEFRTDRQQIAAALTAKGYSSEAEAHDWVLYSLNEDYAVNVKAET
jgi:hypothetical protein